MWVTYQTTANDPFSGRFVLHGSRFRAAKMSTFVYTDWQFIYPKTQGFCPLFSVLFCICLSLILPPPPPNLSHLVWGTLHAPFGNESGQPHPLQTSLREHFPRQIHEKVFHVVTCACCMTRGSSVCSRRLCSFLQISRKYLVTAHVFAINQLNGLYMFPWWEME